MTAKQIIDNWCNRSLVEKRQNKIIPNVFIDKYEADILEITKSGYTYEYEVKVRRSDFFADAKKGNKHELIRTGKRVNYFYYVVPENLISVHEVPDFAGLIYIKLDDWGMGHWFGKYVKKAPKLSKDKFSTEKIIKCLESTYYRFHAYRMAK